VAYDTAQDFGVRSAFRNVPFLDDVAEVAAVRKQLELALRGAREKGEAVAIGHPHPATLQALREVLPQAQAQGGPPGAGLRTRPLIGLFSLRLRRLRFFVEKAHE